MGQKSPSTVATAHMPGTVAGAQRVGHHLRVAKPWHGDKQEIHRLTGRGLRLTQFTVAYNVAEGAIAITPGLTAGLVSLVGFGLDSAIESASAVLLGMRLATPPRARRRSE